MLFFDTSAAIAWLRGDLRMNRYIQESVAISVITVYELLWTAKQKSQKAVREVEYFLGGCLVLPATEDIARRSAQVKKELLSVGKEKPMADLLIAATAEKEGLEFLTFDGDFKEIHRFMDIDLLLIV